MQENATVTKHRTRMLVPRAKLISRIKSFVRGNWRSFLLAKSSDTRKAVIRRRRNRRMGDKLEQRKPRAEVSVHMGELSSARQAFEQSSAGPAGHTVCVKELCMWMAMPNSGSMEAFEKIGAMCSSASKKEGASWLGGMPPNGRSTSGGGREAVWRKHWLDPARSRLEYTIGWACGLSHSN